MRRLSEDEGRANIRLPGIGARIESRIAGALRRGTVHYVDQIQLLVKWDDGSSSSLVVGRDEFKLIEHEAARQSSAV